MEEESLTIRVLFTKAKDLRKQLDGLAASNQVYRDNVQSAISSLKECQKLMNEVSLFSPNETEEDIATGDLPYLSTDYFLAELTLRIINQDRRSGLYNAQVAYERYLNLLETYNILSKSDKKLFEKYQGDRDAFSVLAAGNPEASRNMKIARFKQERALRQKLEHLSENPSALENDDFALRSLHRAELSQYTHETFDSLTSIARELQMLGREPDYKPPDPTALADDYRLRSGQPTDNYSDRLDPSISHFSNKTNNGPMLSKEGRPLRPFTLLDNRQRLQNGVFRPDHSLPSMTIDEYLAEEKRRGGIIDGGGEQSGQQVEPNEDDMEAADKETMKAREWDEFVEANPKGSGNTLNRG